MSLGVFSLVKNEAPWVGYCVMAAKDLVSEFVYFDGNSTDGTVELLEYLRDKKGINIKLLKGQDPKDLQDDYVSMFNECLGLVGADYAWFLHPDMIVTDAEPVAKRFPEPLAYTVGVKSVAGEPGGPLKAFTQGRSEVWKPIHRRAFGLHYFGHYGAQNEDMYHSEITGNAHVLHTDLGLYPYDIEDSGIRLIHFSDVRPYKRRRDRMVSCLKTQYPGISDDDAFQMAREHPRVSLEQTGKFGPQFSFKPFTDVPRVFTQHAAEFAAVLGKPVSDVCWLNLQEAVRA